MASDAPSQIPERRRNQDWCKNLIRFLDSYDQAFFLWRLWSKIADDAEARKVFKETIPNVRQALSNAELTDQALAQTIRNEVTTRSAGQTKQWAKDFYMLLGGLANTIDAADQATRLSAAADQVRTLTEERNTAQADLATRTDERDTARTDLQTRTQERDTAIQQRDDALAQVAQLATQVRNLTQSNGRLAAEVNTLRASDAAKGRQLAAQNNQITALRASDADKGRQLAAQNNQITALRASDADKGRQLAAQNNQIRTLNASNADLRASDADKTRQLAAQDNRINEQVNQIVALRTSHADLRASDADKARQLAAQNDRITTLAANDAAKGAQLLRQEAELTFLRQQVSVLFSAFPDLTYASGVGAASVSEPLQADAPADASGADAAQIQVAHEVHGDVCDDDDDEASVVSWTTTSQAGSETLSNPARVNGTLFHPTTTSTSHASTSTSSAAAAPSEQETGGQKSAPSSSSSPSLKK